MSLFIQTTKLIVHLFSFHLAAVIIKLLQYQFQVVHGASELYDARKQYLYKMNPAYLYVVFASVLALTDGKPQIPEGLGDTISSLGSSAATLIR